MGKYDGLSNNDKQNIVKQGGTPISSKIIFASENVNSDTRLVDAVNIDWQGYKLGNDAINNTYAVVSYMNNAYSYLVNSYSYILQELSKKATTSDFSDLTRDTYIDTQITIYTAVNDKTNVPSVWNNDTLRESLPIGWYENTYPAGQYVFMSSCYKRIWIDGSSSPKYFGPCGTPIFLPAENGLNGNFKSTVFTKTNTTPGKPKNGANYSNGLPTNTQVYATDGTTPISGKEWSDGIPEGNELLWASTAIIPPTNSTGVVWTDPKVISDTDLYDVEFSPYLMGGNPNDTSTFFKPNDSNRHGCPKTNQRWFDPTKDKEITGVQTINNDGGYDNEHGHTPTWSEMIWRAERERINYTGNNETDWSGWVITRIKGEKGNEGISGPYKSTVFKRSDTILTENDTPVGGNYATGLPNPLNGWSDGIPGGSEALWSSSRTFTLNDNTGEWSVPQLVADTPTYDVEFSSNTNIVPTQSSWDPEHKTNIWVDPTTKTYKNGANYTGDFTEMIWRAERTRATIQDEWSSWVITKIKGEDGIIPKPSDYYQTRYTRTNSTTAPSGTNLLTKNNPELQNVSDAVLQTTGGQEWSKIIPDNTDNKPNIWQTSRKVTWEPSGTTYQEKYSDEEWSEPFMLNGLPGESQPIHPQLLYKWSVSPESNPTHTLPVISNNTITNYNGWTESPGIPQGTTNIFLWMIQGEYKITSSGNQYQYVSGNDYWTTPVCLSGKDGKPGNDGDDLEFIYCCPDSTTPTQFSGNDNPSAWLYDATNTEIPQGEDNHVDPQKDDYLGPDDINYTWTDHPVGVDIAHKYEYCSYRRKTGTSGSKTWGAFSQPFAWSIYGENGIDGDGIEYIYYISDKTPSEIISDLGTGPNSKNPANWSNDAANPKPTISQDESNYSDPQQDDYLGPKPPATLPTNWWTDEPTGVSEETGHKYEYVSQRKYDGKTKTWGTFTAPTLWANYAKDGLAINMVLETDNDNVTVGLDTSGLVNADYNDVANVSLKYNGQLVNTGYYTLTLQLTKTYTGVSCTNNVVSYNYGGSVGTQPIISLSNNTITVNIKQGLPLQTLGSILSCVLTAQTNRVIDTVPANTPFTKIFKVTGIQMAIDAIYKLSMSTSSPHRNVNNTGFVPVNIKLKSYTNNSSLATVESAAQKGYFVVCESSNEGTSGTSKWVVNDEVVDDTVNKTFNGLLLPANYNHHKFTLYYKSGLTYNNVTTQTYNTLISGATWMDEEELSAVYDGNNGVDSRSEEYIYLLTDDINFLNKQLAKTTIPRYYDPTYWSSHLPNYNTDDYPFLEGCPDINGIKYVESLLRSGGTYYNADSSAGIYDGFAINLWTDNPQGVSEEYRYEFRAARRYKTPDQVNQGETAGWQPFETPKIWNNYGHIGEDGDGVEYIYYLCNDKNKTFTGVYNPKTWVTDIDYQNQEYIHETPQGEEIWWNDNPSGVTETQKYEYVSVRKYCKLISLSNNDKKTDNYYAISLTNSKAYPSRSTSSYRNYGSITDIYDAYNSTTNNYLGYGPSYDTNSANYFAANDDIKYAMAVFIHLLWKYSRNLKDTKPYGELNNNKSYPDDAFEMFMCMMLVHRFKQTDTSLKFVDLKNVVDNTNNTYYRETVYNIYAAFTNNNSTVTQLYENIYDELLYLGFQIKDMDTNNGGQIHIYVDKYNKNCNRKQWRDYSEPKLWSSHGEPGIPGDPGGSGLVFDFDNPSMQIAVNDSEHQNFIKDNQTVTTYLKVYSGEELIDAEDVTLSISNGHSAFKTVYNSENKFGYTLFNATSTYKTTYYTWTIGDIDDGTGSGVANNGIIEQDEYGTPNTLKLSNNSFIEFKIELYKGQDNAQEYTKRVNLVPIQYGENGQDAELFELHCANSVIHKNTLTDTVTFEPTVAEYKVKHTKGNTVHELLTPGNGNALEFEVYYKLISDNVQYTSSGSDTHTHIYTTIDGLESETGIYVGTGSVINVVNSQQSSHTSQTISTDPTDISGEEEKVISVREVALVDEQQNTLDNAQELILSALDEQYHFSTTLAAAGYVYRGDSITNAVAQLRDYARQLEAQGANYSETASQINATADKIETISNTIGSIDDNTGDYVVNTGYETMYVSDKTQQSQVVTRETAARIREQDVTAAQTSINVNDVTHLEQNNDQIAYGELNDGEQGSGTTQEILTQSGGNTDGYRLATNGQISVQTLLQEDTSVSYIDVQLRHTTDNTVWDTDVLEIVYDGHNGVDGDGIEYIYYISETDVNFGDSWSEGCGNVNGSINPTWWTPNGGTGASDWRPTTPYNGTPLNELWTDHPRGVDEDHPWEYISSRERVLKSGSTTGKIWGRYTPPQLWSHYGETGRDGDGVEYIYAIGNSDNWRTALYPTNNNYYRYVDPRRWMASNIIGTSFLNPTNNVQNYQKTEYIPQKQDGTIGGLVGQTDYSMPQPWHDEPNKNLSQGQYQFVSTRKYKLFTQEIFDEWFGTTENPSDNWKDVFGVISNDNTSTQWTRDKITGYLTSYIGKHIWLPYSEPTLWNYYAKDGETHPFKSTVFKRNATQPETPTGGSYDVPTPSNWSDGIPTGSGPIWASSALFNPGDTTGTGPTGIINGRTGWTTPQLMADTDLYDVEFAFDTGSNSQPATPTPSNRHKDSGPYDGQIWFDPTLDKNSLPSGKSWSDMVWRAEREKTPGTTTWSNWTITRIKGERGVTGESAVVLDFTNDQINLAVDANGHIRPNQLKYVELNLDSLNGKWGDNPEYYVSWSTDANSGQRPKEKFTLPDETTSGFNTVGYNATSGNNSEIQFKHALRLTTSDNDDYKKLWIKVGNNYNGNAGIPEEGIEILLTIKIRTNGFKNHSTNSGDSYWEYTTTKILRICGQHNGENAVTYEIIPSVNSINYTKQGPIAISYVVNKYDGLEISTLSSSDFNVSPTNLQAAWCRPDGEVSYMNIVGGNFINDIHASGRIYLKLWSNDTLIDSETIPILHDGESIEGPQGFSGPIVRYRGVYDSSKVYLTGKYYTGDNASYKYDETSILYKDIVWHETEKNYYVPNQIGEGTTNYYSSADSTTGGCKGAGYLPANSAFNTTNWTKAQQFDFVATKLLYADQALINQISTHDLIATTSAGYPVAGVTSGANPMTDKNGTQIKSPLNTGSLSGKTITNSGSSDSPTSANNNSSVRIFAGEIKKNDKYSLTYAPFNVRQDGTTYMTKARISGDAIVEGDITANTLNLKQSTESTINGSFVNINDDSSENIYLPTLQTGITRTIFVLCNTTLQSQKIIKVQSGQGTLVWGENPKSRTTTNPTRYIYVQSNMLYQLIGMNISGTQTWTVVEIPLSPSEQSVEYKYIDVTKDVMLYGYKANYINTNDHSQGTTIKIAPYSDDEDLCAWGPLVTDNGSDITIEFYTFLDPEIYGDDTDNCALADLSNFAWIYQYGQPVGH